MTHQLGALRVLRQVVSWRRLVDCWEAELACGHKTNTGPGSITANSQIADLRIEARCPTCEGMARQVVPDGPELD